MYKIRTNKEEHTILLPATLDDHFPLIRFMFWSKGYRVVPLTDSDEFAVREEGLKYVNHDICYPFVLMTGQVVRALKSGRYDPKKTFILMPTAGDACRGACYLGLMRYSLMRSHFPDVRIMTINVRHVDGEVNLKIGPSMAIRGLFGLFYGDILMILANQTRPYEVNKGDTDALYRLWMKRLSKDIRLGRNLTLRKMKRNFELIAQSFREIPRKKEKRQKIAVVAEFYVKYCALGNWNIIPFLEENNCEAVVNGASWYGLYYIDSHKPQKHNPERLAFEAAKKLMEHVQDAMIRTIRKNGFHCMNRYDTIDRYSRPLISRNLTIGDGWLLGTETIGFIRGGIRKVLCIAPFGCMANVCAGRGVYPRIRREYPNSAIIVTETDSSGSKLNYYNRVRMLIDQKLPEKQGTR
ncbi:MAG: hypothetical protein J5643_02380 [Lachnospiraceae bacterium]|nr:hypothetical protein [Lachnospiraceae bacterium]MBO4696111.1 hypothetical protein [Lachnospiraceae bacterium]